MSEASEVSATLQVGVVLRRTPGVTRWAKWAWKVTDVLPEGIRNGRHTA